MVFGGIVRRIKGLVEPQGDEAVGVVVKGVGAPEDAQRALIATYAGTRGLKLVKIVEASSPEEAAEIAAREGAGRLLLIYSPEVLGGDEGVKRVKDSAKEVVVLKGRLEGPMPGC